MASSTGIVFAVWSEPVISKAIRETYASPRPGRIQNRART